MASVLIAGAGPSGMAAALFCARRGHQVTLVERDRGPVTEWSADEDCTRWERSGVPHGQQGHGFLARSTAVLREEAPDVLQALLARGAVEIPLTGVRNASRILVRRLVYEGSLRRAVERQTGVDLLTGMAVKGLWCDASAAGIPRVRGVVLSSGERIGADLVVDATGRMGPISRWLSEIGVPAPEEVSDDFGLFYLTVHYRLHASQEFPTTDLPIAAAYDYATLVVFPADNRTFSITVAVAFDDPARRLLREPRAFKRFVESTPLTRGWVERGEAICEPQPMAWSTTRSRRILNPSGPSAVGLVLLGDAAMHTNPTFSRGISLAFMQAQHLARTIDGVADDPLGFLKGFEEWTARNLGVWFESQMSYDRSQRASLYASMRGEAIPDRRDPLFRYMSAIEVLRHRDVQVRNAYLSAYHLLTSPDEMIRNRYVLRRVNEFLNANGIPDHRPEGLDREGFVRLVSQR